MRFIELPCAYIYYPTLMSRINFRCTVPSPVLLSCFSEQKRGLPMGNGSSPLRYAVPAPPELGVDGRRMLNVQWELGNGKRETTDPAARSPLQVLDSSGWSVKDGRSQRDMGNWQTGRGLMAHEPWPMSTGTVLKLSQRGPFAR